jgi:thiol-disulfide isomerase/thioredoxin
MPTLRNRVVYVKDISEMKEQISENELCCVHFATEWCPPSKDMEAVVNTMARLESYEIAKLIFLRDFEDEVVFVHCDLEQVDEILYEMPIKVENMKDSNMRFLGLADCNHFPKLERNWKNRRPERARHSRCFEKSAWLKKFSFLCNFAFRIFIKNNL